MLLQLASWWYNPADFQKQIFLKDLMGINARNQWFLQDESSLLLPCNFHSVFQEKTVWRVNCERSTPIGLVTWYDTFNIFYTFCETQGRVTYIYHYFSVIFEAVAYHLNSFIKSVIHSPWCPAQSMSAAIWCCLETKHEEMVQIDYRGFGRC